VTIKRFRELRKSQKEDRRQAITDTAEEILTAKGIDGVAIRSVAKAAGLSVGSIYVYFKNKEELLLSILLRHLAALDAAFEERIQEQDPVKAFKAMAHDYKDYYLQCGRYISAMGYFYEQGDKTKDINPDLMEELNALLNRILEKIHLILARPAMAPMLNGLEPARGIPIIWSMITGVAELTLASARSAQSGFDFEQVLNDAIHVLTGRGNAS
jgi:AcrR family transcriptional regulator